MNVAIATFGIGYLELGGLPCAEQHEALLRSLQAHLAMSEVRAEEAVILGRWLITQCGGPAPGFYRLRRRIWKLRAMAGFEPLIAVLKVVADSGGVATSMKQKEVLEDVARVFRIP